MSTKQGRWGGVRRGRVVCLSRNMWRGRGDKVDEYK